MSQLIDNAGAILCLLVGLGLVGVSVHDLRLLRLGVWGEQAEGRVESAPILRRDPYGDPTQWKVTTVFNVGEPGKRTTFRCTDILYTQYTKGQKVTVRYRRNRPEQWATIRDPKSTLARASGFGAFAVFLLALSIWWIAERF